MTDLQILVVASAFVVLAAGVYLTARAVRDLAGEMLAHLRDDHNVRITVKKRGRKP